MGGFVTSRQVVRVVGRALAQAVATFLVATFVVFALVSASRDGSPAEVVCGTDCTAAQLDQVEQRLGIDHSSFPMRYFNWLGEAVQGDLGTSWFSALPVSDSISARWALTLEVPVLAQILAIGLVAAGWTFARRRRLGERGRQWSTTAAIALWSLPSFGLAILLIHTFGIRWHLLPATGWVAWGDDPGEHLRHVALPLVALTIPSVGFWAWMILRFRPQSLRRFVEVVSIYAAVVLAWAIGAQMVLERVFALPGIGSAVLAAFQQRDEPVLLGLSVALVVVVVGVGFVAAIVRGLAASPIPIEPIEPVDPIEVLASKRGSRLRGSTVVSLVWLGAIALAGVAARFVDPPVLSTDATPDEVMRALTVDAISWTELNRLVHGADWVLRVVVPAGLIAAVVAVGAASLLRLRHRGPDLVIRTVLNGVAVLPFTALALLVAGALIFRRDWGTGVWILMAAVAATLVAPTSIGLRSRFEGQRRAPTLTAALAWWCRASAFGVVVLASLGFLGIRGEFEWGTLIIERQMLFANQITAALAPVFCIAMTAFSLRTVAEWLDPVAAGSGRAEIAGDAPPQVAGDHQGDGSLGLGWREPEPLG